MSDYVAQLPEPERSRIGEIYARARRIVPDASEGLSYGMPALLYRGKGVISVMSTRRHIGVYPFGNLAEFAADAAAAGLATTTGSIHLKGGQVLPDALLEELLRRRVAGIEGVGGRGSGVAPS